MSRRDPLSLTDPYATDESPPSSAPPSEAPASEPTASVPPEAGATRKRRERPRRSRRRRARWIAGSLVALVVTCGVAVALFIALRPRRAPALPFPLSQLPKETVFIERIPRSWLVSEAPRRARAPEQALWSHFASAYCGGDDVFRHCLRSRSETSRAIITAAVADRGHLADALVCGRELARANEGDAAWIVKLDVPAPPEDATGKAPPPKPRRERPQLGGILIDRSRLRALPASGKHFREGRDRGVLEGARCKLPAGASRKEACGPDALGAAWIAGGPFLVAGRVTELEIFGRNFSPEAEHGRSDEALLRDLADRLKDHEVTAIGTHLGFDPAWPRRLGVAPSAREAGGLELDEPLLAAIAEGRVHFGIADDLTIDEGGRFRMELVASRERVAADVLLELRAWRLQFLDEMKGRGEPSFAADLGYEPIGVERELRVALHAAAVRAIEKAVIERDGEIVSFAAELVYDEGERRAADAWIDELGARMALAAKIVDALVEGDRPEADLLRELGGSDLVDAMTKGGAQD